jgi:DNA-directed RNA polymerase beta' subunit
MSSDPHLGELHNNSDSVEPNCGTYIHYTHNDSDYILFHPLFKRHVVKVLEKICLRCSNIYLQNNVKYCQRCKIKVPSKIIISQNISGINAIYEFLLTGNKIVKVLTAKRCYEIIDCISDSICALLGFSRDQHPRQLFAHVKADNTGSLSQMYHRASSSNSSIKYNANKDDFDGDEMNTNDPHNEETKLELTQLRHVTNQIISPSNCMPLIDFDMLYLP